MNPPSGFMSVLETLGKESTLDIAPRISSIDDREPEASAVALICPEYWIDPPLLVVSSTREKLYKASNTVSPGGGETVIVWISPWGVAVDWII